MRLFLVRHGQTSWNNSGRAQGHTDISLDPTGLDQARSLGETFSGVGIDRLLSSDLARASETAAFISSETGVSVESRKDLRERCFGEWEGILFSDLNQKMLEKADREGVTVPAVRPPGGESFQDVWNRLSPLAKELRSTDEDVVVVAHGGCLSVLLAQMVCGTLDTSRAFRFSNTAITELELRAEGLFMITRYNDTEHLSSHRVRSGSLDVVSR